MNLYELNRENEEESKAIKLLGVDNFTIVFDEGNYTYYACTCGEFSKLKTKSTLNYQAYPFKCELNKFKSDREELYIADPVNYSSNNDSDNSKNDVIFYIQRPDFEACPEPKENLLKWIKSGWQDYRLDADRYEYLEYKSEQGEEKEIFVENENRLLLAD